MFYHKRYEKSASDLFMGIFFDEFNVLKAAVINNFTMSQEMAPPVVFSSVALFRDSAI